MRTTFMLRSIFRPRCSLREQRQTTSLAKRGGGDLGQPKAKADCGDLGEWR